MGTALVVRAAFAGVGGCGRAVIRRATVCTSATTITTTADKHPSKRADEFQVATLSHGTIQLPQQLRQNLYDFLEVFSPRELCTDGAALSRFLRKRGGNHPVLARGTDRIPALSRVHSDLLTKLTPEYGLSEVLEETKRQQRESYDPQANDRPRRLLALLSYQPRECAAFAASRVQGVYGATLRVLSEIHRRDATFLPKTLLDYGSGTGMTAWAANSLWASAIDEIRCVEVSDYMVDLSIRLNRAAADHLSRDHNDYEHVEKVAYSKLIPQDRQFDLVVASYTITEFPEIGLRSKALDALWRATAKYLVLIDHGTMDGFNAILLARRLIEKSKDPETCSIFAPCPQDGMCPRSVRYNRHYRPCSFGQRVSLAFYEGHRKALNYSVENFSYVILVRRPKHGGGGEEEDSSLPRLVAPVILHRGFITCELCTKHCQIVRQNFSRSKDPDVYKSLRKSAAPGDIIDLPPRHYLGHRRVVLPVSPDDDRHVRGALDSLARHLGVPSPDLEPLSRAAEQPPKAADPDDDDDDNKERHAGRE